MNAAFQIGGFQPFLSYYYFGTAPGTVNPFGCRSFFYFTCLAVYVRKLNNAKQRDVFVPLPQWWFEADVVLLANCRISVLNYDHNLILVATETDNPGDAMSMRH